MSWNPSNAANQLCSLANLTYLSETGLFICRSGKAPEACGRGRNSSICSRELGTLGLEQLRVSVSTPTPHGALGALGLGQLRVSAGTLPRI